MDSSGDDDDDNPYPVDLPGDDYNESPYPPQVDEVLSKESEQDLLEGDNPGPMTEIHFWEAKSVASKTILDFE